MHHVRDTIRELRRYIGRMEYKEGLEEADTLLSVALGEIDRVLARAGSRATLAKLHDDTCDSER